jgi:hypothetical protein
MKLEWLGRCILDATFGSGKAYQIRMGALAISEFLYAVAGSTFDPFNRMEFMNIPVVSDPTMPAREVDIIIKKEFSLPSEDQND